MSTLLDQTDVEAGSSVLVEGDGVAQAREQLHRTLAREDADGAADAVLLLATDDAAGAIDSLTDRGRHRDSIGVVDASGECAVTSGVAEAGCVDGPSALSELGVQASERLGRLDTRYDRLFLGLDSVSALLDAQALPAVFRFLHVLTGRVRTADAVFVATFDRSRHDHETVATVRELFDTVVEVPEDGGIETV